MFKHYPECYFVFEVSMEKVELPCPVCQRCISAAAIDAHVNWCLNRLEDVGRDRDGEEGGITLRKRLKADPTGVSDQNQMGMDETWKFFGGISRKSKSFSGHKISHKPHASQTQLTLSTVKKTAVTKDSTVTIPPGDSTGVMSGTVSSSVKNRDIDRESGVLKLVSSTPVLPLAEEMRPKCLADYIGQEQVLGKTTMLHTLLNSQQIPSMVIWGPPGCGKVRKYEMMIK